MIPQGNLPDWAVRVGMFAGAAVTVPAAAALVVSGGSAKAVGIGVVIGLGGLFCLGLWW